MVSFNRVRQFTPDVDIEKTCRQSRGGWQHKNRRRFACLPALPAVFHAVTQVALRGVFAGEGDDGGCVFFELRANRVHVESVLGQLCVGARNVFAKIGEADAKRK